MMVGFAVLDFLSIKINISNWKRVINKICLEGTGIMGIMDIMGITDSKALASTVGVETTKTTTK
jgi:hypothetical protein